MKQTKIYPSQKQQWTRQEIEATLSDSRRKVYEYYQQRPRASYRKAARDLGKDSATSIKFHVDKLVEAGLLLKTNQ